MNETDRERARNLVNRMWNADVSDARDICEVEFSTVRADEREKCAEEVGGLAFCEECHDCYDDLVRSAPYRRAAKYLRDNSDHTTASGSA
jgi:hypothetical protein